MKYGIHYFSLILFLYCTQGFSCECNILKPYESIDDLANYKYIALVKIDSVYLSQDRKEDQYFYEASMSTLTQFKGEMSEKLKVEGGLYGLTDWMTSCDLGISKNEMWLIFSPKDKPFAFPCNHTRRIANSNGEKSWFHNSSGETLSKLINIFDMELNVKPEGTDTTFYPSGQIERIESYRNGQLDGQRTVFYERGSKMLEEYFVSGQRDGEQYWYNSNQTVYRAWNFKAGVQVDTCYYFYNNGTIQHERIFDQGGRMLQNTDYDRKGNTETVNYEYLGENVYDKFRYYKDGTLWYRNRYTLDTHKEILQEEFHPNGIKAAEWDYTVANDTIICSLKRWDIQGEFVIHRLYKDSRTFIDIFKN